MYRLDNICQIMSGHQTDKKERELNSLRQVQPHQQQSERDISQAQPEANMSLHNTTVRVGIFQSLCFQLCDGKWQKMNLQDMQICSQDEDPQFQRITSRPDRRRGGIITATNNSFNIYIWHVEKI